MPYNIFFDVQQTSGWEIMDTIATVLFVLDMLIEFNTAYYYDAAHTQVETNRLKIAWRYLTTWFLFDVVAVLPLEWFFSDGQTNSNKFAKLARVSRTFRMLRAFRVFKLARSRTTREIVLWLQHTLSISPIWNPLLRDFAVSALVFHLFAGVWNYIALKQNEAGATSWAVQEGVQDASSSRRYVSSLYFIMSTLTSVGYGDVNATTMAEELFCTFVMMVGVIGSAVIVADILAIKERLTTATKAQANRTAAVNRLIHRSRPPWALKMMLRNWVDEANSKLEDTYDLLPQLPAEIRRPMILHMRQRVARTINLFRMDECSPELVADFLWHLERLAFKPNEFIYMQRTPAEYMYFLMSGQVVMLKEVAGKSRNPMLGASSLSHGSVKPGQPEFTTDAAVRKAEGMSNIKVKPLYILYTGDNFGDNDVLFNDRYTTSAFTVRVSELFALHRKDLEALCQSNSQLYLILRKKSSDDASARRNMKDPHAIHELAKQPAAPDSPTSSVSSNSSPTKPSTLSFRPWNVFRTLKRRIHGDSARSTPLTSPGTPLDLTSPARDSAAGGIVSGSTPSNGVESASSSRSLHSAGGQAGTGADAFKQALLWTRLKNREEQLAQASKEVDQDMRAIATGRFGKLGKADVTALPSVQRAEQARSDLVRTRWKMAGQVARLAAKLGEAEDRARVAEAAALQGSSSNIDTPFQVEATGADRDSPAHAAVTIPMSPLDSDDSTNHFLNSVLEEDEEDHSSAQIPGAADP